MADVKKIAGYNIKDETARNLLAKLGNKITVYNFTYPTLSGTTAPYNATKSTGLNLTNARILYGYVHDTHYNQNKPLNWHYSDTAFYSACITTDGVTLILSGGDNGFEGYDATVVIASD